ncbi:MAG TPA: alpha/beta hydrolase [Dyadobacter sp.]|nr:alpha/beta hydrolase [Dyadobacter sp.]
MTINYSNGYSKVSGISIYYELYGDGEPLVLLHGGGSTIQTSFGRIIPELAQFRRLICVELQAHGRTGDRDTPISFDQDSDDVAGLLANLNIDKADIFGFSNGATTALQLAINHPSICKKIVAGSTILKRDGAPEGFWEFMRNGTFDDMPQLYKDAFLAVTPDETKLLRMYQQCADRMNHFEDFSEEAIRSIQAPVLLVNGDADVASSEHIVAMSRLIPNCNLAILPGGHGAYLGEITTLTRQFDSRPILSLLEQFL